MTFDVYWKDEVAGRFVDGVPEQYVHNTKLDYVFTHDWYELMCRRVLVSSRWNEGYASYFGIRDWDPVAICRKTHGFMYSDYLWIKFPEDPAELDWETVQLQLW